MLLPLQGSFFVEKRPYQRRCTTYRIVLSKAFNICLWCDVVYAVMREAFLRITQEKNISVKREVPL